MAASHNPVDKMLLCHYKIVTPSGGFEGRGKSGVIMKGGGGFFLSQQQRTDEIVKHCVK